MSETRGSCPCICPLFLATVYIPCPGHLPASGKGRMVRASCTVRRPKKNIASHASSICLSCRARPPARPLVPTVNSLASMGRTYKTNGIRLVQAGMRHGTHRLHSPQPIDHTPYPRLHTPCTTLSNRQESYSNLEYSCIWTSWVSLPSICHASRHLTPRLSLGSAVDPGG